MCDVDDCERAYAAYCYECGADTEHEPYDSAPEDHVPTGVHYIGARCLVCGDIEAEPCVHD